MANHVRAFVILLLVVFSAGTVLHTTSAAAMNFEMTLVAIDGAGMGDCQDCTGGGDNMPPCNTVCVSPALAVIPPIQAGVLVANTITASNIVYGVTGRTGRPEPYPPRSIILS